MGDAADEARAAANGGGTPSYSSITGGTVTGVPTKVYMGYTPSTRPEMGSWKAGGGEPYYAVNTDSAKLQWYAMSAVAREAIAKNLAAAGLIKDESDMDSAIAEWNKAVDQAAAFLAVGKKVTPWEVLNMKLGLRKAKMASDVATPKKQTNTSYDLPTPEQAAVGIKAVFAEAVGRDPTKAELEKYTTMMVGIAKKNPVVTTAITDTSGNTTTSTSGGVSESALRQSVADSVRGTSEYGAYQAATTYFNALQAAIASPV